MNPILSMMNQSNLLGIGKDPNALYEQMIRTNPQFARFVEENKGKSVEQIAKDYNINPALLNMLR